MHTQPLPPPAQTLTITDIYYILFRNKWKILICTLLGFGVATLMFKRTAPLYQSEAKLLVRYIITESKSTGPTANNSTSKILPDERGTSIMTTEMEILSSLDLAKEVATSIGPERILAKAGGGADLGLATAMVKNNLILNVPQASLVIHLTYRHPDPELVQPILRDIIDKYLKLHVEAHRAGGMLGDVLAQEADTLRSKLTQTEDELRRLTNKAGIVSLESAKENYNNQVTSINREISGLEAELAARLAVFQDIKARSPAAVEQAQASTEPTDASPIIEEQRSLMQRVALLQAKEQELLLLYTADSARVKPVQQQLADAQAALNNFREQNKNLLRGSAAIVMQQGSNLDATEAATAWIQITGYQAKIKELNAQLERLKSDANKLDQMEGQILELRRRKELDDANYRYYAANLEQVRINETLGNGKVSNIIPIQNPSPAFRDRVDFKKPGVIAVAGILGGLAWAFLLELYLDRSVRRPIDLQRMLSAPLLLSIPRLEGKPGSLNDCLLEAPAMQPDESAEEQLALATKPTPSRITTQSIQLRAFHETLRDRLIGYFESKNLTHKPKLVAVTGLGIGSGVTTTAAGLARSLSETGEGNVLLVDMTVGQGAAQQFAKGKEVCGLDELLEARTHAHIRENLYVVSESTNSERLSRSLPQRFNKLIPKLKASDFDYIIFDMPAVNQLSITPRLAGFMDMVLFVIESEKNDREVVAGACSLLAESKAHIGFVLNKTKSYVPSRLQPELMTG